MANIDGTPIGETLVGTSGADVIRGFGGNDILVGLEGADQLEGGIGDDTYYIDNAGDAVTELAGEGFDVAYTSVSYTLAAGSEVEWLSAATNYGIEAIHLTGNEIANLLIANQGDNVLNGGGGADMMIGLGGNDVYYVDNAGDQVREDAGGGFDAVYTSTSYTLAAGSEVEWLSTSIAYGAEGIHLTGNELANYIIGNEAANTLNGGGGADAMVGYGGNDSYYVDNAGDSVFESAGGGFDAVYTSTSYTLAAGVDIEWLSTSIAYGAEGIHLTGNELSNYVLGNEAANSLNGGGGADVLVGYGGNDSYYVDHAGDAVLENAGGGFDAVYTSTSYGLAAGAEVEWLSTAVTYGTAAINLTGNELANFVLGNDGVNVLDGGGGADTLYGYGGADIFAFTTALGAGNVDTLDFVAGIDKILLGGAAGQPFLSLATGALRAGTVRSGAAALDADDYLLYNSGTGALLYDADGNGAGAAVQFATIATGLTLTAADFFVTGTANNAPTITSGATAQIAENSPASSIVYQVAANDADGDRISYSLTGADAALLTIDANGAVRLLAPADFETKTSYSFSVVASDSAASTSKAVTLTITDVADTAATPIINETAAANDSTAAAQAIDRGLFVIAANPNLPDPSLPSATIVGNISTSTDRDFFSITLQAGEKLILDVDNSSGNLDTHLRVYGPNGAEIGANDDAGGLDPGSAAHPVYGHNTDSFFSFRAATSGTYYFSLESFQDPQNPTTGTYEINVTVGPPATAAQLIQEDVDALISGAAWPTTNITYSFTDSASDYPPGFGDPDDPEPVSFQQFTPFQQQVVQQLLQHVSNVTVLTFQQLTGAADRDAKLRYAMTSATEAAHAYYPGGSEEAGSAWFNKTNFNTPTRGNYAWMGMLHETGHALGLKHGHEPPALSADRDSLEYSVMTYRSYPGGEIEGGYKNETFGFPQTLMMYDIAALQKIYHGANWAFNATDSVYTWSATTGEMSINGVGQGAPGANRILMTVWDGGGNDTYDFSNYTDPNQVVTIDIRPGEWVDLDVQLANLGGGHFARGNIANALQFEGDSRSLIENVIGTSSGNIIIANQAANHLTGVGNGDVFKFMSVADSAVGAADTIMDFVSGSNDRISLESIDANSSTQANDAFSFIGTGAFTSVAGQLRYEVQGGSAHVLGDVNGDAIADFELILNNVLSVVHTDFFF
jgi:Ca2+-binding RTX toxin-like protein